MATNIESILKLEVPLIVQIARRTMSLEEVMSMTPGAIIELPKLAGDDLEILVNNKEVGAGKAVKVGENFGVRVSSIGGLEQRITAMGDSPDTADFSRYLPEKEELTAEDRGEPQRG